MSCWSPITLKNQSVSAVSTGKHMQVPCGQCLGCLQRKRADWTQRISYEEKICSSSAFITLTYDEFHVPVTENGNLTLSKKDLQKYLKRVFVPKMRYFAVGEYGEHTNRPHYHAAVFNVSLDRLNKKWSYYGDKFGHIKFGKVEPASIHYLTKYIINQDEKDWLDTQPPFRLMSKGLGDGYQSDIGNYCRNNVTNVVPVPGGNKAVLPRYYNEKIFTKAERQTIAQKAQDQKDKEKELPFEVIKAHREYLEAIARKTSKSNKC